jgi:ABC-type lipoprotein release transport system permease subunit
MMIKVKKKEKVLSRNCYSAMTPSEKALHFLLLPLIATVTSFQVYHRLSLCAHTQANAVSVLKLVGRTSNARHDPVNVVQKSTCANCKI